MVTSEQLLDVAASLLLGLAGAFLRFFMTPGIDVDVDGMAMLCEAVDESSEAGCVVKDDPPLPNHARESCRRDASPERDCCAGRNDEVLGRPILLMALLDHSPLTERERPGPSR
jgi:hypothetical protein